jgi:hypothetical protein
MVEIPRRRASELLALYHVKRNIPDLFVEGPSDRALVEIIVADENRPQKIYTADEVEFDIDGISGVGGARGRLIVFSQVLSQRGCTAPFCLIDRDHDFSDDPDWCRANLLITDHACLDLHVYDPEKLINLLRRAFLREPQRIELESIHRIVTFAFGLRTLNERTLERRSIPSLGRSLRISNGLVELDWLNYLSRYDNRYQNRLNCEKTVAEIEEQIASLPAARLWMNIHDLEEALGYLLRNRYNIS